MLDSTIPRTHLRKNDAGLFVVGAAGDFEDGEERFLRNIDAADALHALLAFFLLFEEFAFAR